MNMSNKYHKKLISIDDASLAMALHCKRHALYDSYVTHTGRIRYLFCITQRIQLDIEKYQRGRLYMFAHLYDRNMITTFYTQDGK